MLAEELNPLIEQQFVEKRIDRELSLSILDRYNSGELNRFSRPEVDSFPQIDGDRIVDTTCELSYTLPYSTAQERLGPTLGRRIIDELGSRRGDDIHFDEEALSGLGLRLLPYTAYGVLNGGSATSYVDEKKNAGFNAKLFELNREIFSRFAERARGRPKGLTPAFLQPDGSEGPSFLELKMRSLLILALRYLRSTAAEPGGASPLSADGSTPPAPLPLFQMTSVYNNETIAEAYEQYRSSALLEGLITATGLEVTDALTGIQPLITAFTHSDAGEPKGIFTRAWGKENTLLPLPGGHGQNFMALRDIYVDLYRSGYRYAYLGNVDNLGNTVDPQTLALTALSGRSGAFEFSFKTPVDVKGGVLIEGRNGKLNAVDIGPAVSKEEVAQAESEGKSILFNCATGLFDLSYLAEHIDSVIHDLPIRISDQDKDAGKYSQAEQITWEIIGMMEEPLILGVDKTKRFLASKLFLENLMTSGTGLESDEYPEELRPLATSLKGGLERLLSETYGMKMENGRWLPKSPEEL